MTRKDSIETSTIRNQSKYTAQNGGGKISLMTRDSLIPNTSEIIGASTSNDNSKSKDFSCQYCYMQFNSIANRNMHILRQHHQKQGRLN